MPFINTTYTDNVQSSIDTKLHIIKNERYLFTDKRATPVTYFNKDTSQSTLDEAAALEYSTIGENCPSKFNMIDNALLFGLDKINVQYDNDELGGIQANEIAGEAYILPNTFVPYVGDFFIIKHIRENILFKVIEVQTDTLDDGANFYKISYKVDQVGAERIDALLDNNINKTYKMLTTTIGTNFKSIITDTEYDFIEKAEANIRTLKEYFKQLFFEIGTQTFIYKKDGVKFYDPFMIEFIRRNKILDGTEDYVYVGEAMATWATFGIEYDKTFLRALNLMDKNKADKCDTMAIGNEVTDMLSLMTTHLDTYFYIDYRIGGYVPITHKMEIIPNKMIDYLMSGNLYSENDPERFYNIIIKSFDPDWKMTDLDLHLIDDIMKCDMHIIFYAMPMLIFVLENQVKKLLIVPEEKHIKTPIHNI